MKPKLEPKPGTDIKNQVESELKRTRRELESTKNALKHQVARCRHLVSAFSKRLAEKDVELKHCKETREKQLGAVIRALLVLEARLRREQKCIRGMLSERDLVIRKQLDQIQRLEAGVDPDWAARLGERDREIERLRGLCRFDSPDETDKSVLDTSDGQPEETHGQTLLDFHEETDSLIESPTGTQEDFKRIIFEKEPLMKSQQEHILGSSDGNCDNTLYKDHRQLDFREETQTRFEKEEFKRILFEKEALIKSQQEEIDRLRSLTNVKDAESKETRINEEEEAGEEETPNVECYAKPDLISSLCIDGQDEKESSATQPDSLSSDAASTRACLGDNDADSLCNCTITPPVLRGSLSVHDRSAFSPVPRSNKFEPENVVSPTVFAPDSKPDYSRYDVEEPVPDSYYSGPAPSKTVSMRSFDINYQDNPVLQCVNQILLKDQDDILEDRRPKKLPSIESPFVEIDDADQPFWATSVPEEEPQEVSAALDDSPRPALATSSPLEKSDAQEASIPSKGSKLSLSKLIELHNAARKLFPSRRENDGRKSVSMSDLSAAALPQRSNQPAPPKHRKSGGKRVDFNVSRPTESKSADNSFLNNSAVLPPQPVYIDRTKLDIISKPSPLPFAGPQNSEVDHDNELYVISNSALDDEILQKLKGKNLKSFEIKLHRLAGEAMMQQQARRHQEGSPQGGGKPALNKAMLSNINLLEAAAMLRQLREASDPRRGTEVSPGMSHKARLRVAASVAQLLAQAQQQAREQQLQAREQQAREQQMHAREQQIREQQLQFGEQHQRVKNPNKATQLAAKSQEDFLKAQEIQAKMHTESQLSIQAERIQRVKEQQSSFSEAGTSNQETSIAPPLPLQPPPPLDPSDNPDIPQFSDDSTNQSLSTDPSQSSDTQPPPPDPEKSPGTYDNFLEATGLSQKSIMTPSRMLNNHRSVLKPKDVKHRSKVRSAAIFERTIPPQVVGPTIKYWTEPYL